jgi:serine/threonine protein kinase
MRTGSHAFGAFASASGTADTHVDARSPREPRTRDAVRLVEAAPHGLDALVRGTPYRAVRRLGEGGMGEIVEVVHATLRRPAVLKVLHERHRARPDLALRLRDEARAVAGLEHPGVVSVFDLGTVADGRPYYAMERLVGSDLRRIVRVRGALELPRALDLAASALDALAAAHDAGILHRDVKLENLFLCTDGRLKLLDFGVAHIPGAPSAALGGRMLGTPRAMAPEQAPLVGAPVAVDVRADVYAAGIALYELVAGRGPFDELGADREGLRLAHARFDPPPPSLLAPQPVPWAVDEAILRALAKRPGDRFPSARAMADALRALRGERRRGAGVAPVPLALRPPGRPPTPAGRGEKSRAPRCKRRGSPTLDARRTAEEAT